MASHIAEGPETAGARLLFKKVEYCTLHDLTEVDGIAVGSPTQYSNIAWQITRFPD